MPAQPGRHAVTGDGVNVNTGAIARVGVGSAHILCIDQSTSATKAMLFDQAGVIHARSSIEHRQIYPQPGWVEHDAEEIWRNVQAAVRDTLAQASYTAK